MTDSDAPKRPARKPIVGDERVALRNDLAKRYAQGATIRQLAKSSQLSYGLVHTLLTEAEVEFRPRGESWRIRRHDTSAPS
jgi:hypothetical protein